MNLLQGLRRAAVLVLLASTAATAAPPELLTLLPRVQATAPTQPQDVVARGTPVQFNAVAMLALTAGAEVELTLPDGSRIPYLFERSASHGGGIRTWIGRHRDLGREYRAIVTTGPYGSFGSFSTPAGEWRLVPGSGHDVLIDLQAERANIPPIDLGADALAPVKSGKALPLGEPPRPFVPLQGTTLGPIAKATPAPVYDVDLMIVYTNGVAQRLGGTLMTRLYFIVDRLNVGYSDSEVAIRLRLVRTKAVNYSDTVTDQTALNAISPNSGAFDSADFGDVETLRTQSGADLVLLMRNGGGFSGSGVAWIGSNPPQRAWSYSQVKGCVLGCEWIFMHELGHNMGLMHDRPTSAWQAGGTSNPAGGIFAYSFGYAYCASGAYTCDPFIPSSSGGCTSAPECSTSDPWNFGDAMAYFSASTNRNYRISNPDLVCYGSNNVAHVCGVPVGDPQQANGALSLNNTRAALAATVSTVVPDPMPGSIQFSTDTFGPASSPGSVSLTLSRLGGTAGPVQATWSTRDGNALAGVDYVASNGTVSWADGDGADKTITVALVGGSRATSNTFFVDLLDASGTAGVYLGGPSTAVVLVPGPWPAGSSLPEGFSSDNVWTVASDFAYEGSTSVRSPHLLSTGGFTTTNLSFSADFDGGTLAFAYRVSDAGDPLAWMDFMVDAQTVLHDSGETGWRVFSMTLPAGRHTIRWMMWNSVSQPCSGLASAPGGAACADYVWLDALALPANRPVQAPSVSLTSVPNPSTAHQAVTFNALVSGASGTPTGTVEFRDGSSTIGACNAAALSSSGSASCTTSSLSTGTHSITAVYSGDGVYVGATSAVLSQVVQDAGIMTTAEPVRADFNGDGRADLVWLKPDGQLDVWLMDGATPLEKATVLGPAVAPLVTKIGDFDGDGKTDIVRQFADGTVKVFIMNGTSILLGANAVGGGSGLTLIGVGDFNGDGKTDLVMQASDGTTFIMLMNGATVMQSTVILQGSIAAGWYVTRVADFDGDGKADLLWTNPQGGIGIWTMNGASATNKQVVFNNGSGWSAIATADFNGDGKADIVFAHTSGAIGMWLMNGAFAIQKQSVFSAATGWSITQVADLNGDGKADLVWTYVGGDTGVWLMDGLFPTTKQVILPGNTGWLATQTADLNGDGRQDLLWTYGDGSTAGWLMDGLARLQGFNLQDGTSGMSLATSVAPNN